MKNFAKKLFCGAMAATLLLGASACNGGGNKTSVGDDGSGVLRVWGINPVAIPGYQQTLEISPNDPTALYTKYLVESFEEANPTIKIQLETAGWELDLNKNIMTAIAAGTQPDAMATATYTPLLSRYGHLKEIKLPDEIENDIDESLDDFCFHQGKRYAVPVINDLMVLAVNKGVLRKAGILNADNTVKPEWAEYNPLAPETMEDLLVICQAVKDWASTQGGDNGKIGGFIGCTTKADSHIRTLAFMAAAGGDFADNYGEVYLNSQANIKAYEYLRELYKTTPVGNASASSLGVLFQMFYEGMGAYGFMSAETVDPIIANGDYPNCKPGDIEYFGLPVFEGHARANVSAGAVLFAILDDGDNPVAAEKFINHLLSFEAQKTFFDIVGRIPVRESVLQAIKEENSARYQKMKYQIDPFIDDTYVISKGIPTLENNTSLCWDAWNGMWNKVVTTDEDIATLVKNCHNQWVGYLADVS